jgi:DNA-binding MarR family transcriptional regulator
MTYLYNPRRASSAELDRTFVARAGLLKELLDQLRTQVHAKSLQHLLIVGPRGSGKTHLTTLLARRIRQGDLNQHWRPIQLAEEHWEVSTVRELILAAFEMLETEAKAGQPLDDPAGLPDHLRPAAAIQALKRTADPKQGAELGIALLNELARRTGRRNLLILENVDEILDAQFHDDFGLKQLRSELMTGSHSLLIATSPGRVTGLEEHDYPLFGLFRVYSLEDFSLQDLEELLRKRSELESAADPQSPAAEFQRRLVAEPHRIRALLFLTGGNPRMALMLYRVLVQGEVHKAREELDRLLDELTNYFRERVKELPPQERKIVVALAKSGRAMRPSEIAAEIGLRPQQMSTLISRLIDRGHLRLAPQREGKGRYYVLREILFRYWHHWRAQEREFLLFVEFLAAWFRREELERWLAEQPARPQQEAWGPLLQEAITQQPRIIDRLSLNQQQTSSLTVHQAALSLDELSTDPLIQRFLRQYPVPPDSLGERLFQADRAGDWSTSDSLAVTVAEALRDGTIPTDQELGTLVRVLVHGWGDGPLSAANAVHQRRSPDTEAHYLYAVALARSERHAEAAPELTCLEAGFAADEDPVGQACCWYRLAVSQVRLNDLEGCERSLLKARATFAASGQKLGEANCLMSLGDLQLRVDDLDGARASYAAALPIYREVRDRLGEANTLNSMATLSIREGRAEEAVDLLRHSADINAQIQNETGSMGSLGYLGDALMNLRRPVEAVLAYESSLTHGRRAQDAHGQALTLWRQAASLEAIRQGIPGLAALFLCEPLAKRAQLDLGDSIRRIFEQVREELGEGAFRALTAELEADAETVRQRGVQAAAAMAALRERIRAHQPEVDELTRLVRWMQAGPVSAAELTVAQQCVVRVFEQADVQDIAAGLLQGGLLELLRAKRPADALAWIDRLDGWLPETKRGLFAPLAVAARHLRGEPADARILDQQAPEVREAVEMILREAQKAG